MSEAVEKEASTISHFWFLRGGETHCIWQLSKSENSQFVVPYNMQVF